MGQRIPGARLGRASAISRLQSRSSASATLEASLDDTLSRSSRTRSSSENTGALLGSLPDLAVDTATIGHDVDPRMCPEVIAVDASAALSALLNDGPARSAVASERLHAPHLIDSQVANGLRRRVVAGQLGAHAKRRRRT